MTSFRFHKFCEYIMSFSFIFLDIYFLRFWSVVYSNWRWWCHCLARILLQSPLKLLEGELSVDLTTLILKITNPETYSLQFICLAFILIQCFNALFCKLLFQVIQITA